MTVRPAGQQMHLAVFLTACGNYHALGWRHPEAWVDAGSNFARWIEFARISEAAKLDMLFIADQIAIVGGDDLEAIENSSKVNRFEPTTLLSALASHTSRIGLAGTCATSYSFDDRAAAHSASALNIARIALPELACSSVEARNAVTPVEEEWLTIVK